MDTTNIINALRLERDRIDAAISAFERYNHQEKANRKCDASKAKATALGSRTKENLRSRESPLGKGKTCRKDFSLTNRFLITQGEERISHTPHE